MKKFAILILALICVNVVMAQSREGYSFGDGFVNPPRPTLWNNSTTQGESNIRNTNQSEAPITPATLLLLVLGGLVVGATVISNTKKGGA